MIEPSTRLSENWRDSIESCMAFSSIDWTINHRGAWIYGIIFGYTPEALAEQKRRHDWDDETVARLEAFHRQYKKEKDEAGLIKELKIALIADRDAMQLIEEVEKLQTTAQLIKDDS